MPSRIIEHPIKVHSLSLSLFLSLSFSLSLSLSVSISKSRTYGHLAFLFLKELYDGRWMILVLKLIDFNLCIGGASNEGRRTPEQGTQRYDPKKQAESGEMMNIEHDRDSKGYLFFGDVALLSPPS